MASLLPEMPGTGECFDHSWPLLLVVCVIILKVGCGFSQTARTHFINGEIMLDRKKDNSEMKIYWARHGTRSCL